MLSILIFYATTVTHSSFHGDYLCLAVTDSYILDKTLMGYLMYFKMFLFC